MFSPAYEIAKANAGVVALLGNPLRFYDFGDAAQDGAKPYAVQQVIAGNPENYLAGRADADNVSVQIDVYGLDMKAVKVLALALQHAFELHGYITGFNGTSREPDTRLWRVSFTVEFITDR